MPRKKPKRKTSNEAPSQPNIDADASQEFGSNIFTGEDLKAMRRELHGKVLQIADLKQITFPKSDGDDVGGLAEKYWYVFTTEHDKGFKIIKKAGLRLARAFGNQMGDWTGQKIEIQVVEYVVGIGPDIFPVIDDDDDDEGDDNSDENLD